MTTGARSYNLKRMSAMVVDDEQYMLQLLSQMLGRLGIGRVESFYDPMRAMEAISVMSPDLVLVDWKMRPINGTELVRHVRGMGAQGEEIGLFMVTGHADIGRVRAALTAGVDDFIVKPVAALALRKRINRFIDLRPALRWKLRDESTPMMMADEIMQNEANVQLTNDEISALFD